MILISSDNVVFKLPDECAILSITLKDLLCTDEESSLDEQELKLDIESIDLKIVVDFLTKVIMYENIPSNINLTEHSWYNKYISELELKQLIRVANASNFLNIESLLELCCARIAYMIKGKSKEEMRLMLGLENDFTPEEEKKIQMEHEWVYSYAEKTNRN